VDSSIAELRRELAEREAGRASRASLRDGSEPTTVPSSSDYLERLRAERAAERSERSERSSSQSSSRRESLSFSSSTITKSAVEEALGGAVQVDPGFSQLTPRLRSALETVM